MEDFGVQKWQKKSLKKNVFDLFFQNVFVLILANSA